MLQYYFSVDHSRQDYLCNKQSFWATGVDCYVLYMHYRGDYLRQTVCTILLRIGQDNTAMRHYAKVASHLSTALIFALQVKHNYICTVHMHA